MTTSQYRLALAAALVCVATMVLDVAMGVSNLRARSQASEQQQFLQQSAQLETLYREMVRGLAELGARANDADVRALLQRHGITYSVNTPPAQAAGPAADAPKPGVRK